MCSNCNASENYSLLVNQKLKSANYPFPTIQVIAMQSINQIYHRISEVTRGHDRSDLVETAESDRIKQITARSGKTYTQATEG
jgi:hypothetical protein